MAERQGRGAWPSDGLGGTLDAKGHGPGKFYSLADHPLKQVGLRAICNDLRNEPYSLDDDAVFHGVLGIQALLVTQFGAPLKGDGVYGLETYAWVKRAQTFYNITSDGIVGRETMKWLLWAPIHDISDSFNVPWKPVFGLLQNEGNWDPGAVGWLDSEDLGLAQINMKYHPETTVSEAFCPSYAIRFMANYMAQALAAFGGNLIDAVASYNLGFSGVRKWIQAGRPEVWTPPWSTLERKPYEYANRILTAADE